jgi:chromosome segregation ATPase
MRIDAIRWFPIVEPPALPDKSDELTRRIEKHQEDYRAALKQKKVQDELEDIQFQLYLKKAEQNQIRLEIFTNRKLDFYV